MASASNPRAPFSSSRRPPLQPLAQNIIAVVLARKREAVAAASAFMCLVVTGLSTCGSAMPACSPQTRRHLRLQ
ncbi:hypothetical protein DAI22_03g202100 [Oryza sativa Japonica Group]|nr:hypothetical protein DAI22_03g202100 [Oryza sativa Japonica Group]